jgi:hypothetical protein
MQKLTNLLFSNKNTRYLGAARKALENDAKRVASTIQM